jgi:cytidylate kinase
MESKSVALDGPSGAGKSTLARRAAERFGFIYVDTGALYRSVGLCVLRNGVLSSDESGVVSLLPTINLEMKYVDGVQRMILNCEDITEDIRTPEISKFASDISALVPVRDFLLDTQRDMAKKYDVIMDGRDIGTVVLPNAGLKVFLVADAEVRAKRRYDELIARGMQVNYEDVLRDLNQRDKNDSEREAAPLKAADDAVTLDTSKLDFEQSVDALCKIISERFNLLDGRTK